MMKMMALIRKVVNISENYFSGMRYLHQTDIKSHGNLKSSNCVIDSRWTLKLTDFGLNTFKSREDLSHMDNMEYHQSLLWHAPELLRSSEPVGRGTQKADVFSFAIILQEFHTREVCVCKSFPGKERPGSLNDTHQMGMHPFLHISLT